MSYVERHDTQQERLLDRLRSAAGEPVAFTDLHAGGIDFPVAVVAELELGGYVIDRVHDHGRLVGVRLLEQEPPQVAVPLARSRRLRLRLGR